jgi:hypothetical protein
VPFAAIPAGLLSLVIDRSSDERPKAGTKPADNAIPAGQRNQALASIAGKLRRAGLSDTEMRAALAAINAQRCEPPLDASEVDKIAASIARYAPADDGRVSEGAPTPLNILRGPAAVPLRPSEVPAVLGVFADTYARATGFDVSMVILAGIVASTSMLSDEARLNVAPRSGWFESARLWGACIAGPGTGKTPSFRAALAPIYELHRESVERWRAQTSDGTAENAPPCPALFTSDATTEALSDLLRDNPRGLLYAVDELESWLGSHDAYRSGAGRDRGEWLRLYDGGPHQVNRVQRGRVFVPNWGVSLLSATTPHALRKLAPRLPNDGLLQRILLVIAQPIAAEDAALHPATVRSAAEAYATRLRAIFTAGPAMVRLSDEAHALFDSERRALQRLIEALEALLPSYAAHVAKRAAILARVALTFHALERDTLGDEILI